jgi:cellulose synthase/poly-beta-1,6-N-acetylglucosamine synthase-like glycosyltransferase
MPFMHDLLLIPIVIIYLAIVGSMFLFGIDFLYMTYLSWRHSRPDPSSQLPAVLPRVTIQLPVYNELYVAERLVEAAARIEYPSDLLEIQVLDDSTDETGPLLEAVVSRMKAQGLNIYRLHRADRQGYKAGALANGLEFAQGEFLAVFDADFVPPANFLMETVPYFKDPRVAFIQTRWGHLNRGYSLLTRLQSLAIDAHFMIEQFARSRGGYWFNFNGTAGIWRKEAISMAGGWTADTLTEDLDLSYRIFLKGWRAVYLRDTEVPAELPVTMAAFRRQQQRWARGSLECLLKYIPQVWKAPTPLSTKAVATFHLAGYGVHLLQFALCFLYPLVVGLTPSYPALTGLWGLAVFFNLAAFAPTIFFASAQIQLRRKFFTLLPEILFLNVAGSGMMVNTAWAACQILLHRAAAFERTPKFGVENRKLDWASRKYQLKLNPIVFFEIGLGLLNAATIWLAASSQNWGIVLYATLYSTGLFFVAGLSVVQTLEVHRRQASGVLSRRETHATP